MFGGRRVSSKLDVEHDGAGGTARLPRCRRAPVVPSSAGFHPPSSAARTRATAEHRYGEAEAALQRIGPLRTWTPAMAALGLPLRSDRGRVSEARAVLAEFDELKRIDRYASAYAIAVGLDAGLGDRERTFSFLDAALSERSHWLVWLNRDPRWDEIRSESRFQTLVRRVGLPSERSLSRLQPK